MPGLHVIESLGGQCGEEFSLYCKEKPSGENAKVGIGPPAFRARYHASSPEPRKSTRTGGQPGCVEPAATAVAPTNWIRPVVTNSYYQST
jgi:hypothetical protein